jgi:GTP-binding protein
MADIPGIIEGASEGAGLGRQFLRHIERTRVLIHVLDVSEANPRSWSDDYVMLNKELESYSELLAHLPQVIALNKIDIADPETVAKASRYFKDLGKAVYAISAATRQGTAALLFYALGLLKQIPRPQVLSEEDEIVRITVETQREKQHNRIMRRQFTVEHDPESGDFIVRGAGIERLVSMTQLENEHALARLQRVMEKAGIVRKLKAEGAVEGSTVRIGNTEFDFIDEDSDE